MDAQPEASRGSDARGALNDGCACGFCLEVPLVLAAVIAGATAPYEWVGPVLWTAVVLVFVISFMVRRTGRTRPPPLTEE